MPRPTRQRTSLPSHGRSAQLDPQPHQLAPDDLTDSIVMSTEEMAPIATIKAAAAARQVDAQNLPHDSVPSKPKQTKADKAYSRRKELLEKVNASATPYSKSHARRLRRHAKPANNLVASLAEVEAVLPQLSDDGDNTADNDDDDVGYPEAGEEGDYAMDDSDRTRGQQAKGAKTGGKGKEKLTAKKRQRVLTAEAARLPAIIKNESFAKSPFATIRQHTLNTLVTQKNNPPKKGKAV